MVLNSSAISNDSVNDSLEEKRHMVVNTIDFNNHDLEEFVTISEEIERTERQRKSQRRRSRSRSNTMVATMTREEIFESTNLDDDQFLNALEHQNSLEETKNHKALAKSIENLMKYFNEDVTVKDDSSAKATPTKKSAKGKVASAVATFRNKYNMTPSPSYKIKKQQQLVEVKSNIQELKKRYELSMEVEESSSPKSGKQKSPKISKKSKVKQMALLFNSKINSMIRSNTPEAQTPEALSPGLSSIASPNFTSTLKPKSPKLKPKLATFIAKLPSPKPSPFFKRKQLQKSPSLTSLSNSPLMRRKQLQKQPSTTCLVAESVFSQLSVKDKALLYNKFIADMSKQNPKFSKHAEVLELNVKKEVQRGEVIFEKQGKVKDLRDSLEAKFTPTKTLSKTLQRFKKPLLEYSLNDTRKSKEYEDILNNDSPSTPMPDDSQDLLHVSTLTVILKPSPESKKSATKPRTSRKKKDVRFLTDLNIIEPSFKRTQDMIRSSLPVEPYAPPKKIRRTRHERLAPKMFFQNQHLEKLFYNWLKEKNGVAFDITTINNKEDVIAIVPKNSQDNIIPKTKVDKILEEAINKLEHQRQQDKVSNQHKEDNALALIKETLKTETSLEKSVIEVELPIEVEVPEKLKLEVENKLIETEDSDLGLTSIPKTTSEESHTELITNELLKPSWKQLRKKKIRKSKEKRNSDSDTDCKLQNHKVLSSTLPKTKKHSNYVKKLIFKTGKSSITSEHPILNSINTELNIIEFDRSLIKQVNSPSKIKTAYTLTVMSSPSPHSESDFCESELARTSLREISRSWPSLLQASVEEDSNLLRDKFVTSEFTNLAKNKLEQEKQNYLMDSFIDQGFETGSNDTESPLRLSRKSPVLSRYGNSTIEVEDKSLMNRENPKNFSTPNKDKPVQQIFTAQLGVSQHNLISPIPVPPANRRPPSLTMQAIQEDTSLEDSEQSQHTPNSFNGSGIFFSNEPMTNATSSPLGITHKVESSQFWISSGDFTAAIAIHHYEMERLMLLSNIFNQKSVETKEINFGIDDQRFYLNNSATSEDIIKKIPKKSNSSIYWFSTGSAFIPFTGKHVPLKKIQAFFNYIREFMEESGSLRFGIDTNEFCNIYKQTQNCSLHVNTNSRSQASPLKTSDLDQSNIDSESLSFSALSSNQSDTTSLKSDDILNHQSNYSSAQETESLDQLFSDARLLNLSKTQTDQMALQSQFTVPEMLKTLQHQQSKLKSLEERMLNYATTSSQKDKDFNESPEYMRKLRSIISAIDNIGRGNGFNACSIEQLERFMFFLSRYADLCLANCTAHIEKILDVVMNQRSFQV